MQLIALGDNIINLDNVSVLDIDPTPNPNAVVVHVHCDSTQSVIDITIPRQVVPALINMVPQNLRFAGSDDPNS
jgi:glutamate formiminotransferase